MKDGNNYLSVWCLKSVDIHFEEQVWFPAYGYRCRFVFCSNYCPRQDGWRTGSAHLFCKSCVGRAPAFVGMEKLLFMYRPTFFPAEQLTARVPYMSRTASRDSLWILPQVRGKGSVRYLNIPYIKAWQSESDMWVWKVLIAFQSWFHPTHRPPCQCQNPAEFALQDVLLRWKPAVSCSSTGSRFRCFGSVASKSRGTHIFRRIRVA